MRRIRQRSAVLRVLAVWTAGSMLAGCRFEWPAPPKGFLERRLIEESWSSFSEVFSPHRGYRIAFLPFRIAVRESGRMSETWKMVGPDVLELTTGSNRHHRYRWFESAQLFALCREGFRKPFFVASDSMSAPEVFEAARRHGIGFCDASTVLRIAGGRVQRSDSSAGYFRLVDLSNLTLTRQDRAAIRDVHVIETLVLSNASVVDVDLAYLSGLESLTNLALDGTAVSDQGLKFLTKLPLHAIDLSSTGVTDAGIVALGAISTLETLHLSDTPVTQAGIDSLRKIVPGLKVETRKRGA